MLFFFCGADPFPSFLLTRDFHLVTESTPRKMASSSQAPIQCPLTHAHRIVRTALSTSREEDETPLSNIAPIEFVVNILLGERETDHFDGVSMSFLAASLADDPRFACGSHAFDEALDLLQTLAEKDILLVVQREGEIQLTFGRNLLVVYDLQSRRDLIRLFMSMEMEGVSRLENSKSWVSQSLRGYDYVSGPLKTVMGVLDEAASTSATRIRALKGGDNNDFVATSPSAMVAGRAALIDFKARLMKSSVPRGNSKSSLRDMRIYARRTRASFKEISMSSPPDRSAVMLSCVRGFLTPFKVLRTCPSADPNKLGLVHLSWKTQCQEYRFWVAIPSSFGSFSTEYQLVEDSTHKFDDPSYSSLINDKLRTNQVYHVGDVQKIIMDVVASKCIH